MIPNSFVKIEQKGRRMNRCEKMQKIAETVYDGHHYSFFLVDNFCMNKFRYRVVVDGTMALYTYHFDEDLIKRVYEHLEERKL